MQSMKKITKPVHSLRTETIMRDIHLSDAKSYRNRGDITRARIAAGMAAACTRRLKALDADSK